MVAASGRAPCADTRDKGIDTAANAVLKALSMMVTRWLFTHIVYSGVYSLGISAGERVTLATRLKIHLEPVGRQRSAHPYARLLKLMS